MTDTTTHRTGGVLAGGGARSESTIDEKTRNQILKINAKVEVLKAVGGNLDAAEAAWLWVNS